MELSRFGAVDALADSAAASALRVATVRWREHAELLQRHAELLLVSEAWWQKHRHDYYDNTRPPADVVAGWRAVVPELQPDQARRFLDATDAIEADDPRAALLAEALASGRLVEEHELVEIADWPLSRADYQSDALGDYYKRRAEAVSARRRPLPFHRRIGVTDDDLAVAHDRDHLVVCSGCRISRERTDATERCPICGERLVSSGQPLRGRQLRRSLVAIRQQLVVSPHAGETQTAADTW